VHIGFWWIIQKERDLYEDPDIGGMILEKQDGEVWDGLIWLRIRSSEGLL
jgi:hypothetical protein